MQSGDKNLEKATNEVQFYETHAVYPQTEDKQKY